MTTSKLENSLNERLLTRAHSMIEAGICVVPALAEKRRPLAPWKKFIARMPTMDEFRAMIPGHDGLAIICGEVSGGLEAIDFDQRGVLFEEWKDNLDPELFDRLIVQRSQSGGAHVFYRARNIEGNRKLASREGAVAIETRGQGGLILADPSPGYKLIRGDWTDMPTVTDEERMVMIDIAVCLSNDHGSQASTPPPEESRAPGVYRATNVPGPGVDYSKGTAKPGDDFNIRGDIRPTLIKHGWVLDKADSNNEHWRRPGKDKGSSATFNGRCFYVFSSNAPAFEPNRGYSPFAVFASLEAGGDPSRAASILRGQGYGNGSIPENDSDVDLSRILSRFVDKDQPPLPKKEARSIIDPSFFKVPGFIGDLAAFTMRVAPYPNETMAFAGALSLLSFLAGRKFRDPGDVRPNIYLLGLGHSASGKDMPRKINTMICNQVGMHGATGERFASGEGLQDALLMTPAMLFQTDEIDSMLQSMTKSKDARHESIMSSLLTIYSSANSILPMRRKAGDDEPKAINQPHLTLFGTGIPNHYYAALSERMLSNGFFARFIVLESGPRARGQEPEIASIPSDILAIAQYFADCKHGEGNMADINPTPAVVPFEADAIDAVAQARRQSEIEYAKAEAIDSLVGTTVWGRVAEHARKLALLYALSENHLEPRISRAAVDWATEFVFCHAEKMILQSGCHVAENEFHAELLKIIRVLKEAPDNTVSRSEMLRKMRCKSRDLDDMIGTLIEQGTITIREDIGANRTTCFYVLSNDAERED